MSPNNKLLLFLILLFIFILKSNSQEIFFLNGKIIDKETNQPIPAVNVRIKNTSKGTITNSDGFYQLSLQQGEYCIVFSHVGYKTDSTEIFIRQNYVLNISLIPVQIQLPEIVVIAEDPAVEIIRKAIANKHIWMNKLKSYKFEAFTRQVIYSDTAIAGISEAYTDGYWLKGDTLREIVRQKRQTMNIPASSNLAAVRQLANFNEDVVRISGYSFVGPTAQDALDNYNYKLLGTYSKEGYEIYEIAITPKSRVKPLFEGKIQIADYSYAVVGIDVIPNEAFNIPFVSDLYLNYKQAFSLYEDEFWLPVDVRINGSFKINFAGFSFPKFTFEQTSVIYEYSINIPIPDTVLTKPRVSVDSSVAMFDSVFWREKEFLPLTSQEKAAYDSLDSTKTFGVMFRPGGISVTLFSDTNSVLNIFKYIDFHFNRVEGFYLAAKYGNDSLTHTTSLSTSLGYGFSDNLLKAKLSLLQYSSLKRSLGFGFSVYAAATNVPDENFYDAFTITLSSLIGKNDYRDYYFVEGWQAFAVFNAMENLKFNLSFISEWHKSLKVNTDFSIISLSNNYRENPPVTEGKYRALKFALKYGNEPVFLNLIPQDQISFEVETSNPKIFNSNFDFTRLHLSLSYNFRTFLLSHLFSPVMRISLFAGTSFGSLPPQKFFTLDTRLSGVAPFGVLKTAGVKDFVGDKFIHLNLEHNFRSIPFLALGIPFFYKKNTELLIFASFANIWFEKQSISNGWFYEAGIGLGKIFDILRIDLSYRFPHIKRTAKFFLTLSTSTLF